MNPLNEKGEKNNLTELSECKINSKVSKDVISVNNTDATECRKKKLQYVCNICSKVFNSNSAYQKHERLYPKKHKYYTCCKKVGVLDGPHKCKKNELIKSELNKNLIKIKFDKNKEKFKDLNISDSDKEGNNENENKVFEEKKKRPKKKTITDQDIRENDVIHKIFKCQECLTLFEKYSSLSQHIRTVHNKQGNFKCQVCDEEFDIEIDYEFHVAQHDSNDKVICKGCKRIFNSLKSYYIHAKQNPGIHCYLCKLCLRKFPTELMLEQHVCICQNGKPLYCACGMEFTKYEDVIIHSKGTKPFYCCTCPHFSTSLTAYIRHLRKHSKQKPYHCTKCDMKFAVIDFLNIHNKKCHSETVNESLKEQGAELQEQVECTSCDETCNPEDLKQHSLKHECVQCPDCGKLLKRNRLEIHRNSHKTSASLCPECGKLFETRFKLTQHLITTHNNEPVKCDICMKVLKTKKILNEHMKTHLKSEVGARIPQAICPMCGLGLAQKGSLARHILLTHEKHKIVPCDKTYTCQECSAVLPNRAKYYSHRRMHRAMVDRFPCEVCGREFNKKQNLRRHMYLLHDEKRVLADPIFKCQICTRCFREKKNLKRHYKMVHKLDDVA